MSFLISTGMFAMVVKFVPDVKISWKGVWLGAVITAILFAIWKFAIGLYLARSSLSSYGVAGSMIVLLVWVYYSAQIVFLGAEFIQVYANRYAVKSCLPKMRSR